jgi:hypothetical protein
MKKLLFLTVLLAVAGFASADVSKTGIRYDTVQPATVLERTLRNLVDDINGEFGGVKEIGTGNIYYVDSGSGSNTYDGKSVDHAKATLDAAVGLCTADNGDVIYIMPGHSEAMGAAANEVDIDVAGVTIIGLGNGKNRPLFDYTGDVTGAFAIGADDVILYNLQFCANVSDVNEAIEIEAGSEQVTIANCIFFPNAEGTDEFLECIDGSGGAASDRTVITGCHFTMGAGAANSAICLKDSDYAIIENNVVFGDYTVACINQVTTASNHIVIRKNLLFNGTIGGNAGMNTEPAIELLATTTGFICDNYIVANLASLPVVIVADDCFLFQNYTSEDESAAATGALVGTASAS